MKIQPVIQVAIALPDFLCGDTGHNGEGLDIPGHHGARRNDGSFANRDPGQNDRPVSNPDVIPNDHISTAIGKCRGLRIMAQRQNRRFGTDRNIMSRADDKLSTIQDTAPVDDISLPQINLAAIEKSATHLHPRPAPKAAKPTAQEGITQRAGWQASNPVVVAEGQEAAGKGFGGHDDGKNNRTRLSVHRRRGEGDVRPKGTKSLPARIGALVQPRSVLHSENGKKQVGYAIKSVAAKTRPVILLPQTFDP